MPRLLRLLKNIALIALLVILGIAYLNMAKASNMVTIWYASEGFNAFAIENDLFFYIPSIFLVIFNMLLAGIASFIRKMPAKAIPVPNKNYWTSTPELTTEMQGIIDSWIASFVLLINLWTITLVLETWEINRHLEGHFSNYFWHILIGSVAILGWFTFLLFRFQFKK